MVGQTRRAGKMGKSLWIGVAAVFILLTCACSLSRTRMVQAHVEETRVGTPIRNVLIIAVINDRQIRTIFEKHVQEWFNAYGVEAVTSSAVLPIDTDTKLEKAAIAEVVGRLGADTVVITHPVGFAESEVFSRDRPRFYYNYYGFYNYAWGYVTWPTIYGENVEFDLETRLYDVKTESLIWAGETQTTNPKTTGQAIGQVVEAVMKELQKNGLLPKRS
jgi:hypothetical protein